MTALRIHENGVDQIRVALPFEPWPFGTPGFVNRVQALEHDAFRQTGIAFLRFRAKQCERLPVGKRDQGRKIEPRVRFPSDEMFKPLPSLAEGKWTDIFRPL